MKTYVTIVLIASAVAACDKTTPTDVTQTTSSTVNSPSGGVPTTVGDNPGGAVPTDQGKSQEDLRTTEAIRKALRTDDSLSAEAKDVKVITNNGVIVLRGLVKNDSERQSIVAQARASAATSRVEDEMEISFESNAPSP